jgi:flagellar FliL protein
MSGATAIESAARHQSGKRGRTKLLLAAGAVGLVAVLGGLWATGVLPALLGTEAAEMSSKTAVQGQPPAPVFVAMPDIVANLNGNPRRPSYIKLGAKLELSRPEDQAILAGAMPRVMDLFQTYVRELRPEELRGSAGIYRLREELIARANVVAAPARVVDVLFTEVLVQ